MPLTDRREYRPPPQSRSQSPPAEGRKVDGRHSKSGEHKSSHVGQERHADPWRRRNRSRSRSQERHRSSDSRQQGAGPSRSRERQVDERRPDKVRGGDREDRGRYAREQRHEDSGKGRDNGTGARPSARRGSDLKPGATTAKPAVDFARLIPGWDRMSPAEQLKARVRLSLQQAGDSSRLRDREESEQLLREGDLERGGSQEAVLGAAAAGAGVQRPWTRYVFDRSAPLDEEQGGGGDIGRASLAFLEEREAGAGAGVDGEDLPVGGDDPSPSGITLNALSFRVAGHVAAKKQRDNDHDAAIFGSGGGSGGGGVALSIAPGGSRGPKHEPRLVDGDVGIDPLQGNLAISQRQVLAPKMKQTRHLDDDDDGPVVVDEEEIVAAQARATGGHNEQREDGGNSDGGRKVPAAALSHSESEEVKLKHQTLSWRERALQARKNKA